VIEQIRHRLKGVSQNRLPPERISKFVPAIEIQALFDKRGDQFHTVCCRRAAQEAERCFREPGCTETFAGHVGNFRMR
jgi:hypothetical protein